MEVPQKLTNRTTVRSSNSTSGYFSEENKNTNLKRNMHSHVHCSNIHNSQDTETICVHQWMNGLKKVYTYNGVLFSHIKEGNPGFCHNMDEPEDIILSEVSQAHKDKYYTISPICGI